MCSVSFQATRLSSLPSAPGVVQFDNLPVNHWSFNQASNTFTAPVTGYYWIHMTVAIPKDSQANVLLRGLSPVEYIIVSRTSTNYDGPVTTSTDSVAYLNAGTAIQIITQYPLYSDSLLQTSFGCFLLDSIMSPVVAFAFGLSNSFICTLPACSYVIPFNVIYLDTHYAWNSTSSAYIVPVTGTYVISLSAGTTSIYRVGAYLQVNSVVKMYHVYTYDIFHSQPETYSGLGLVSLKAGDVVSEVLYLGTVSPATVFSGFLYSPYLTPAVAFSVGVNKNNAVQNAPLDPVPYDTVLVNQGNGWNKSKFTFTAPFDGVYYIHVTSMMAGGATCQKDVLLNGVAVVNYMYMSTTHSSEDSRSRGFILRLKAGDELRVRLTNGTYYIANNLLNHFAGFLLHF